MEEPGIGARGSPSGTDLEQSLELVGQEDGSYTKLVVYVLIVCKKQ